MTLDKQKEFIAKNYLDLPTKRIAKIIGRSYTFVTAEMRRQGLEIPEEVIEARKNLGRFKRGQISANKGRKQSEYMTMEGIEKTKKTRFKKGHLPHNTKHDYAISLRSNKNKPAYFWIRVSKGNWALLHRYIYELAYGPIPEEHLVQFKDGNQSNVSLDNLYLTTRRKQVRVNQKGGHELPFEIRKTINLIYQIKAKVDEKQNSRSK